ncbi:hypothetical protein [Flavobacterium sp.]|uniref:hypothetical protein n=1 Tax=Flavobacterium sp. TaxID=239 RepID=UPI003C33C767
MIEIYKTNIIKKKDSKQIAKQLQQLFPDYSITFDLEDCDRILRINTFEAILDHNTILKLVYESGFYIEILSDEIPILKV